LPGGLLVIAASSCVTTLPQRFETHVGYLAGDDLEGRGVGSQGIEEAADYIADQFAVVGLTPAGEGGTYFQSFEMTLHRELTDEGRLTLTTGGAPLRQGVDFLPLAFSSNDEFDGPLAFCGYGIVATDRQHDDFVHSDLAGKAALMFRGEPPSWSGEAGQETPHALLMNKVYNAKDRGATAVLFVNPKPANGEADELIEFVSEGADDYGIPAFHVSRAAIGAVLESAGVGTLDDIQQRLDAGSMVSAAVTGVRASGGAGFRRLSSTTRNVVGLLPGHGPHADEYVVIGAHYDHLGIRKPMMRKFKGGKIVREDAAPQIHNGADDNASGTGGLIETARLFANGPTPRRSILFVAFTAEESGLHGSKYLIEHPLVPLDRVTTMLNMDMIGRLEPGKPVQVFGTETAVELADILKESAAEQGLTIAPGVDYGGRSDHAPFVRKDIPALHFFSGQHVDYHKPSDDADKINTTDAARIVRMVHGVARRVADRDSRLTFQAPKPTTTTAQGGAMSFRVVMGIAPSYGDDGKPGMGVDAVSPEGPAEMAGVKAGDRVLRIGDKPVANIYDYMAALRSNNPGDVVAVTLLRDGQELKVEVTLSGAR
jgi:hypothetical protein